MQFQPTVAYCISLVWRDSFRTKTTYPLHFGSSDSCRSKFLCVGVMEVDDSCLLVLIQCRDREWYGDTQGNEAWAWEAAQRCLCAGFGVLRVATQNWSDVKREHPEWFQPLFREKQCRQEVICTINYIHHLCPALQQVHALLQSCDSGNVTSSNLEHRPEGLPLQSTKVSKHWDDWDSEEEENILFSHADLDKSKRPRWADVHPDDDSCSAGAASSGNKDNYASVVSGCSSEKVLLPDVDQGRSSGADANLCESWLTDVSPLLSVYDGKLLRRYIPSLSTESLQKVVTVSSSERITLLANRRRQSQLCARAQRSLPTALTDSPLPCDIRGGPCHCKVTGLGCSYVQETGTPFCLYCDPTRHSEGRCSCPCRACDPTESDWSRSERGTANIKNGDAPSLGHNICATSVC
jgi:hypothetical protein